MRWEWKLKGGPLSKLSPLLRYLSLVALQRAKSSNPEVGHTVGSFKDSLALKFNVKFVLDLDRDKPTFSENGFYLIWVCLSSRFKGEITGVTIAEMSLDNSEYAMKPAEELPLTDECHHYQGKNEVPWDIQK